MASQQFNEAFPCPSCKNWHALRSCTRFLTVVPFKKMAYVTNHRLCSNCLAHSHLVDECESAYRCRRCHEKHNTVLHPVAPGRVWFYMTARVKIFHHATNILSARVLFYPLSETSGMTKELAKALGCSVRHGQTVVHLRAAQGSSPTILVRCSVQDIQETTAPRVHLDKEWCLNAVGEKNGDADALWFHQAECDLVLGRDYASRIYKGPTITRYAALGEPYRQNTIFGMAYFGEAPRRE